MQFWCISTALRTCVVFFFFQVAQLFVPAVVKRRLFLGRDHSLSTYTALAYRIVVLYQEIQFWLILSMFAYAWDHEFHRMVEDGGHLAQSGPPRANCPGQCPGSFWVSLRMGLPSLRVSVTLTVKKGFVMEGISCVSVSVPCLCHLTGHHCKEPVSIVEMIRSPWTFPSPGWNGPIPF